MANNLIIITNHFPYGLGEAFLENEIDYLTASFDKVVVLARDVKSTGTRTGKGNFRHYRVNPESSLREKIVTLGLLAIHSVKVIQYLREEIAYLRGQQRKISSGIWRTMIHDLVKALTTAWHIERIIEAEKLQGKVTLYAYWLTSSALATTLVKNRNVTIKRISRAHGGDVHEYRATLKYLSFRYSLASHLDRIFSISENSAQHLKKVLPENLHSKISVSRLGTAQQKISAYQRGDTFTVVSCAFLAPVKRMHLIVDALSHIDNLHLHWIHIGDGPQKDTLITQAEQRLGSKKNIRFEFKGNMTNHALLEFYRDTTVDLFINTSSSEGIPVTMMEAQSFGIPIVGPAVGGVPEIVNPSCGRLFPVDATPEMISHAIREILTLPVDQYQSLRTNAIENWNMRFAADHNFPIFVAEILKL